MSISRQDIETLRNQLNLSEKDFCDKLEIDINNYDLFRKTDNFNQLSTSAVNKLNAIMHEQERTNLATYKERFPRETDGYFANNKILKHFDKLSKLESSPEQVGPITVEFHPTNICNHRCPACTFGIPTIDEKKRSTFDINLMDKLILDLKKLDVKGIDISGGGEPLCHNKIDEIIVSFAKKFKVGLVTNGYGLDDEENSKMKKKLRENILTYCTWCRISVDAGSQEIYSLMHGNLGHIRFDDIIKKIQLIAKDKVDMKSETTLGISFLLTPNNFLDLIKSIYIFREIKGIDYFQVKPIVIDPSERIASGKIFWDKGLFELLTVIKKYETEEFKIFTLPYKFSIMLESNSLPFNKCWGHPFYPTISADGRIYVCCHMLNNFLKKNNNIGFYGKIDENKGFLDIWNEHSRFKNGDEVTVGTCPINCKLSETNKILDNFHGEKIMHTDFIN